MAEFITLDRSDYDMLRRMADLAVEQSQTIDMVLDFIKDNADTFDFENVYVHSLETPEKLVNIFRYRMPEEWQELEAAVIDREIRKEDNAES